MQARWTNKKDFTLWLCGALCACGQDAASHAQKIARGAYDAQVQRLYDNVRSSMVEDDQPLHLLAGEFMLALQDMGDVAVNSAQLPRAQLRIQLQRQFQDVALHLRAYVARDAMDGMGGACSQCGHPELNSRHQAPRDGEPMGDRHAFQKP